MIDLPPPQMHCLAVAIYEEARGEPDRGKEAVGHVVMTRSKERKLTPCQVITQPKQFSFKMKHKYSGPDWRKANDIASKILRVADPTRGARYFHSIRVSPGWPYKVVMRIGNHIFYK